MASKILKIYLRLFIFIGMMSSINSKNLNYQQMLTNSGFQSSEHQVLFQKIGFYAATVQYQHVVIPIPLWETIQELIKISDNLGKQQQQIAKSKDPYAKDKANLIESARKRVAKVVNNINDIIESLTEDLRHTKWMVGEIFGSVGTLMGILNSWEINRIAKGVGENLRRINIIINISDINSEHLQNLKLSVDKITDIIIAMLKYSPAQLKIINPISTIIVNPGCKLQLKAHLIQPDMNQCSQFQIKHHSWNRDIQLLFPTSNLSLITLREQGAKFVTAHNLKNLKFSEKEISQWFSPNYVAIVAIIFFLNLAYKYVNKWTSKFTNSALDKTLNHLNKKEYHKAIKLKEQVKL